MADDLDTLVMAVHGSFNPPGRGMDVMIARIAELAPRAQPFLADLDTRSAVIFAAAEWLARERSVAPEWRRADLVGQKNRDGLAQRVEQLGDKLSDLARDAQSIAWAFMDAEDEEVSSAATALLHQSHNFLQAYGALEDAHKRFQDAIPAKLGGRGTVSAHSSWWREHVNLELASLVIQVWERMP